MAAVSASLSINAGLSSLDTLASKNVPTFAKDSRLQRLGFAPLPIPKRFSKELLRVSAEAQKKKYTGYVEKDTAGQENIYAVEPDLYVSKSAISTNSRGDSSEGSGGTLIISGFLALAAVSGAAAVLLTFNSTQPAVIQAEVYSGPPLNYYVLKFQAAESALQEEIVEASISAPEVVETPEIIEAVSPSVSEPPVVEAVTVEISADSSVPAEVRVVEEPAPLDLVAEPVPEVIADSPSP